MQAFNFQTFYVASSCWSSAIATSLLLVVKFRVPPPHLYKYERYYHIFCWGIPLIITLSLMLGNFGQGRVMGDATFWCWTVDAYPWFRIYFYFGVMWICFIYNSACYMTVGIILYKSQKRLREINAWDSGSGSGSGSHSKSNNEDTVGSGSEFRDWKQSTSNINQMANKNITKAQDSTMRRFSNRTSAYILAFVIIWTPGTVNRIQNIIEPTHAIYSLFVLHAICLPIGGFMEASIWFAPVITKYIRKHLKSRRTEIKAIYDVSNINPLDSVSSQSRSNASTIYELQSVQKFSSIQLETGDFPSYTGGQTLIANSNVNETSKSARSNWTTPRGTSEDIIWNPASESLENSGENIWANSAMNGKTSQTTFSGPQSYSGQRKNTSMLPTDYSGMTSNITSPLGSQKSSNRNY
ncbi:hypothetical protein HK096_010588 [Nowakowskiella sp. JEL0078]|nr:hypothetical protein HK096_010588 [Nowakowskiella sp. JEL0078]